MHPNKVFAEEFSNMPVNEFNLKEFIYKYLRYIPFIIACVFIALIIAFIKIRYSTPIYSVKGSVFINKDSRSGSGGSQSLEDMFLFSNNVNLKNELEILHSRPLVKRVVQNLGLSTTYYNKGNIRSSNIYGANPFELKIVKLRDSTQPFSFTIEADKNGFKTGNNNSSLLYNNVFENSNGVFILQKTNAPFRYFESKIYIISYTPADIYTISLAGALKIVQTNDQATILDISIETDNTEFGKDVINNLISEYAKMNVEDKREISRVTMQFIDERLDTIKDELGSVETGLMQFRQKNNIIDLQEQSKIFYNNYGETSKQLIEQEVQMGIVDYLFKYLESPVNRFKIVPTDLGIQEPVLLPLLNQYNTLQLQRNSLQQTTGPSNQTLVNIESGLEKLREQILEALRNVKQAYRISINRIQDQLNQSQSNIKSVPGKAKDLLDIERQQKIKQELYLFLLQKREEAAISAAATVASSRMLEDALANAIPVKPNRIVIYLTALIIGLLIPILIIAIRELLNDKITQREDLTKETSTPIVGEVGHADDETLVVKSNSRAVISEQFRILRTNLQYLINKLEKPVILVTSSVSGEGKSFIATNYGAVMALTGKRTVILEFDIRRPRLLKGLSMQSSKGLSNYILGEAAIDEIVQVVPDVQNLFVIGCGPIPPNPSELLLDNHVNSLFIELKERFDVIVIDTAPVGLVSDAFTLSSYADASLYIVRQGYTLKKQVNMINDLYYKKRLPNMGLLVNDIKLSGRYKGYYGYGGGSYYGYGYGYAYGGEYFSEGKKNKKKWVFLA
ncbi:MAG: polysaccharide biosynthesis tyrosine autokinase [Agriterribacter sp.]